MAEILGALETTFQYIGMLIITKYVFLEKGIDKKYSLAYYISTSLILATLGAFIAQDNVVTAVQLLFAGINIFCGRKKHKIRGMFLILPIIGYLDGLFVPLLATPKNMLKMPEETAFKYSLTVYSIIIILMLWFLFSGKKWRERFIEEASGREMRKWEKAFLSIVGVLLLFISGFGSGSEELSDLGLGTEEYISIYVVFISLTSFLMTLALIIMVILNNKQSFYHKKVLSMQFNIIVMMAEIVENRDKNTGGHIRRTAKYVEIIANELKKEGKFPKELTDNYINNMIVAAPLHDIGKIHVSDIILNKNGRLTDEEFAIMKTHANAGRELLLNAKEYLGEFEYLDIAIQMAGSHHEWFDGSVKGYPDRTAGNDIPLCARIMAVADVFDALVSKRCYKDPMPVERAYSIIQDESGSHFDPDITDAFFAASKEIEAALAEFNTNTSAEPIKIKDTEKEKLNA